MREVYSRDIAQEVEYLPRIHKTPGFDLLHHKQKSMAAHTFLILASQSYLRFYFFFTPSIFFVCLFCFVFQDRVSLCYNTGCPGTCFVDQIGLKLKRSTCLCHPNAEIKCLSHQCLERSYFKNQINTQAPPTISGHIKLPYKHI